MIQIRDRNRNERMINLDEGVLGAASRVIE